MKMNGKHEMLTHIARPGLLLAALLAMVLSSPAIIRGQSTEPAAPAQSAKPVAGPAAANQAPVAAAMPSAAPAKAAESLEEESPNKGTQEGIKIHAHWTIEVRNPDGKVQSHTEFENSLLGNGPLMLASLLAGQASSGGGWQIALDNNNQSLAPCANASGAPAACFIVPQPGLVPGCAGSICSQYFQTLTVTPNSSPTIIQGRLTGSTTVTLQGTATAGNSNGVVGSAFTFLAICASTVAPINCSSINGNIIGQSTSAFSGKALDGIGTDPAPVPITAAGQTIAVTVQFSFQ